MRVVLFLLGIVRRVCDIMTVLLAASHCTCS